MSANKQDPYIKVSRLVLDYFYNPDYGDDRICKCGHPYYRHFDTYEKMGACGCKYCGCFEFIEEPKYNFYKVSPTIFLIEMEDNNELADTFLRVQEFYESINNDFRGKEFTILQYKDWYCSQEQDKVFRYAEHWAGFNVPSSAIKNCYRINNERTPEDMFLLNLCEEIERNYLGSDGDYYLCGVRKGDTEGIEHEMAHGFFASNIDYKRTMVREVGNIDADVADLIFAEFTRMGYSSDVHIDELQAHLSTGLINIKETEYLLHLRERFGKIFNKFLSECGEPVLLIDGLKIKEQSEELP